MKLLSLLPRILAIFLIILPPLFAIRQPEIMQGSDFVMTFYPAGAMIASGQAASIYPPPGATSFIDTPFNLFVHKLLTYLPKNYVAIYMYSPLVAAVFVPFSWLPAPAALVLWQAVTVAVIGLIACMFAHGSRKKALDYFFMMILFCPIFHTQLIGHLGVVLGLLPLSIGYLLWIRGRELAAGYVWGFLAFKPQFLPAVLLVAGSLLLTRRFKVSIGLVLGLVTFAALSATILGPDIFLSWLRSLKMADTIFANPAYGFPEYMVVSLPAVLLQSFPHTLRATAKLPIYGLSAVIGLFTLWRCVLLLRSPQAEKGVAKAAQEGLVAEAIQEGPVAEATPERPVAEAAPEGLQAETKPRGKTEPANGACPAHALIMTLGLLVLPLVLPHFLFYDMCGLALICVIAYQDFWNETDGGAMRAVRRLMWWVCNIYYCGFMFLTVKPLKQWYALALVIFYGFLYYRVLKLGRKPATKIG